MRICLFGDARSIHVQRLAVGLARRGLHIHVVSHKEAAIPGVGVEKFSIPPVAPSNPRRWRRRWRNYLRGFLRQFDVVNVHFLADWGFEPEMFDEGRVVASAWGSDVVAPPGEDPPALGVTDVRVAMLRHAAAVTAWGPTFAQMVADFAGISAHHIDVVPLGVDLSLFDTGRIHLLTGAGFTGGMPEPNMPAGCRAYQPATASAGRQGIAHRRPISSGRNLAGGEAAACVRQASARLTGTLAGVSRPTTPSGSIPGNGHRTLRVGFFKGFRKVYGAEYLIRAIPIVLERRPSVRFDLIGDGPERTACRALANQLAINDSVQWIPRQPHGAIARWLASWDLTVIPSLCEAFGFAALESQAMRVPVVASNVGGLPDAILDGKTGMLVPARSPRALAEAILTLLTDPVRRRNMGRAGREWVTAHFAQEHVLDQWVALYERVAHTAAVPA